MRHRTWIGLLLCGVSLSVHAAEPLVVDGEVVITEPMEVGDVVILAGGVLRVEDVPEPGFQLAGDLFAVGDGEVHLVRSVVRILSEYHGQFIVGGIDHAHIEVAGCDYRAVYGVQHALVASGLATVEVVDGTGGFFGSREHARVTASGCRITCTVEATGQSSMRLTDSVVEPYEIDPDGLFTRIGAYDDATLLVEHTTVGISPALGGNGVLAAAWLDGVEVGGELAVWGALGLYSLDGGPGFAGWRVSARPVVGGPATVVATGDGEVTGELLGTVPMPAGRATLIADLTDGRGRTTRSVRHLAADGPATRPGSGRP